MNDMTRKTQKFMKFVP